MDGGSTDGTREMVNSFKDSNFLFWDKNSGGPIKPRNKELNFLKVIGLHF